MRHLFVIIATIILATSLTKAQHLTAYTNIRDYFYAFDAGEIIELEYQPIQSSKISDTYIAYVSQSGDFKVYYNGKTYEVLSTVDSYELTDSLVVMQSAGQLLVFEKGEKHLLSTDYGNYTATDQLVAFFDKTRKMFQVYYKGEVITLDDNLLDSENNYFATGENTVAYLTPQQQFRIFYAGEQHEIGTISSEITFKAGKDLVAFWDESALAFKVFYNGQIYEIEDFEPQSYRIGDGALAYVDNSGVFKVFTDGKVLKINDFAPENYFFSEDMLIYYLPERVLVLKDGQVMAIENFIPENIQYDNHHIVYANGKDIVIFNGSRKSKITLDQYNSFLLRGETILIETEVVQHKIYYQGKIYKGQ